MTDASMQEEFQDVLVGEDDKDDFEMLEDAIKSLSLKVILKRADNGDILMKLIHERVPDLLFLDLVLPRKDGKSCIREIRSDSKFDDLPIIVYTALHDLDSIEFCFREGTNLYVNKPESYSGIVDLVQKIFAINWKQVRYYPTRADFVLQAS